MFRRAAGPALTAVAATTTLQCRWGRPVSQGQPVQCDVSIGTCMGVSVAAALGGWRFGKWSTKTHVPKWADKYNARTLYTAEEVQAGIRSLATQLNRDFKGKDPPILVGILGGAYVTLADLTRMLDFEHDVDFIKASSYGSEISSENVKISLAMKFDVKGRDVVLVDELVDTAKTFACVSKKLESMGAKSVKTLCVVDKTMCHQVNIDIDYCALQAPNEWVFGYGMDCKERLRSLPYIGIVTEEFKQS